MPQFQGGRATTFRVKYMMFLGSVAPSGQVRIASGLLLKDEVHLPIRRLIIITSDMDRYRVGYLVISELDSFCPYAEREAT